MIPNARLTRALRACGSGLFLFLGLVGPIWADGELDTTFNGTGKVTTPIGTLGDSANAVAIQSDGKIVAGGNSESSRNFFASALARYKADGSLDDTFGVNGKVATRLSRCGDDRLDAIVIQQSDGKIVTAGSHENRCYGYDFGAARFDADGSLDTSFGSGGKATVYDPACTGIQSCSSHASALTLQNGNIVLAGGGPYVPVEPPQTQPPYGFHLARFSSSGGLDTNFGPDGSGTITTYVGNGGHAHAYAVAVQSDGKIVAAGHARNASGKYDFALARYDADGKSLDTGVGTDGIVITPVGAGNSGEALAVVIQPDDGKIVAAGYAANGSNNDFALVRYNSDGSLDTSFGEAGTGRITTPIGSGNDLASALLRLANGKFVAAGYAMNASGNYDFALARYSASGKLDTCFGTGGIVTTPIGAGEDVAMAIALQQADNKIVVAGYADVGSNSSVNYDFALVRYLQGSCGTADTTPPVIVPQVTGTLGNNGWYRSDVHVNWQVSDPDSAITSQIGCDDQSVTSDTSGTTLTCTATSAGGTNSASVTIKRDTTPPVVTATARPPANADGWRRQNVTVTFSGTDSLSGAATCDPPVLLSLEGAGQTASGRCFDAAGNPGNEATATGINIDKTVPSIAFTAPFEGAIYRLNQQVTAGFICIDPLSGVGSCSGTVPSGQPIDTSKKAKNAKFTVTAIDKAGNSTRQTVIYTVTP